VNKTLLFKALKLLFIFVYNAIILFKIDINILENFFAPFIFRFKSKLNYISFVTLKHFLAFALNNILISKGEVFI
jgi:hypothetical protein